MKLSAKTLRPALLHVAVWVGFIIYELSLVVVMGSPFSLSEIGLSFLLNAALFYINALYLMPLLYARRYYVSYSLGLMALLVLFALTRYALNSYVFPELLHHQVDAIGSFKIFWAKTLYRGMYFILPSIGYWFARNAIRLEKQKREQEHELRLTERNLMQANIAFLKNQINPHFLFNSLNFLYAQVYPHSEKSAKGILLLSDIMRYALKEEEGDNGKVMLTEEIEHLNNYIAINQLRFNHQLQIQFETQGNFQFLMILPLVLITFVENCFKHGELADPLNPLQILLQTVDNQLTFQTRNKKRTGPKEKSTGIGLANTRQRLDIVYPGRYNLTVKDEQDYYTCTLIIKL